MISQSGAESSTPTCARFALVWDCSKGSPRPSFRELQGACRRMPTSTRRRRRSRAEPFRRHGGQETGTTRQGGPGASRELAAPRSSCMADVAPHREHAALATLRGRAGRSGWRGRSEGMRARHAFGCWGHEPTTGDGRPVGMIRRRRPHADSLLVGLKKPLRRSTGSRLPFSPISDPVRSTKCTKRVY